MIEILWNTPTLNSRPNACAHYMRAFEVGLNRKLSAGWEAKWETADVLV